jgi:hypothetical protein
MAARAAQGSDDGTAWVPSAGRSSADGGSRRVPAPSSASDPLRTASAPGSWRAPTSPEPARDGRAAGPTGESEGARLVRAQVEAAQERARQAAARSAEVDALRTSVRSPRGEVTVEVDAGGRVTRVAFSERARAVAPTALGPLVEETIRAAARACGARAVALVEGRPAGGPLMAEAMRAENGRRWA